LFAKNADGRGFRPRLLWGFDIKRSLFERMLLIPIFALVSGSMARGADGLEIVKLHIDKGRGCEPDLPGFHGAWLRKR